MLVQRRPFSYFARRYGRAFSCLTARGGGLPSFNYKKVNYGHPYNYAAESTYRIELKNAKDQPTTVKVQEPIPGDWEMIRESFPHTKIASGLAEWEMKIPADGKTTLEYKVLVRY